MHRRYSPDGTIINLPSRASERSISFSDLRADADTRLLRIWFDAELEKDDPKTWRSIDIARGGLSIRRKLETAEFNNTRRNIELLKQVSRAAFALYQPERMTDDDGNLIAIALPRNSALQLGQSYRSDFNALRGSAIAPNHVGLYVDDDDVLAIEAYEIDNIPQFEVIGSDSEAAVRTGLAPRDYLRPRMLGTVGEVTVYDRLTIDPLNSNVQAHAPEFLTNIAIPIGDLSEHAARTN